MKLSTQVARAFATTVRARGNAYFLSGAVRLEEGSAVRVVTQVRGSRNRYEVEIDWEERDLSMYCECPYFASDGPCKHLWATVLYAESAGLLSAVQNIQEIYELESGDDDFEDFEDETVTQPRFAFAPPPKPVAPLPKVPQWKKQMAGLAKKLGTDFLTGKEWPEKREIRYIVELRASGAAGETVVSFHSRDRKLNGEFGVQKQLKLDRNLIPQLPAKVGLDGKFAAAQVIVFAKLQSGEVADITRFATLKLGGDCAKV
ncbi:MAG: SWIM zinc finger family protein, partial [Acidobacteria bacterium]|nr:SWIM zinc finger family protein [Acidobacteriota bacterium]